MNWVLQATGEIDREITDPHVWAAIEDELAVELHKVLSQPRFGATHSLLGLRLTQGPVHKAGQPLPPIAPSLPAEPEPAEEESGSEDPDPAAEPAGAVGPDPEQPTQGETIPPRPPANGTGPQESE